jgi:hypothetical protein
LNGRRIAPEGSAGPKPIGSFRNPGAVRQPTGRSTRTKTRRWRSGWTKRSGSKRNDHHENIMVGLAFAAGRMRCAMYVKHKQAWRGCALSTANPAAG